VWGALGHCQVLRILHNPRYAGAYVFGRHHSRKTVDGRSRIVLVPREEWETLIPEAHAGYLSWEHYEQNQKRFTRARKPWEVTGARALPVKDRHCCRD